MKLHEIVQTGGMLNLTNPGTSIILFPMAKGASVKMTRFDSESDAYAYLEKLRWPNGPECPHCGTVGKHYYLAPANTLTRPNNPTRKTRTGSESPRRVWKCAACRKQFSVTTGTVMHGSKVEIRTWLMVIHEMCANKNGIAAREIERKYGVAPKTAWFMAHRLREGMRRGAPESLLSGIVLADETFIGGSERNRHVKDRWSYQPKGAVPVPIVPSEEVLGQSVGASHPGPGYRKSSVLSLIDTQTGEVRSKVIPDVTGATLRKAISEQVDMSATELHTDEWTGYRALEPEVAAHRTVNHSEDEYVRYEGKGKNKMMVSTNALEGYFSQLKRSIDGTHHHVSTEHLPRYLAEFDFRYSTRKVTDEARVRRLMGQVAGRRLTYRRVTGA